MAAWPARVVATGVATPARRLALVASTLVALAAAVVCTQPLESTVVVSEPPEAPAQDPESSTPFPMNGLTAPDPESAMSLAIATGESVEDLSQREAAVEVFAEPNGTWQRRQWLAPVWVQRGGDDAAADDWVPLDLTLVRGEGGTLSPSAYPTRLEFESEAPAGGVLVTWDMPGTDVTLTVLAPAPVSAPVVEGGRARYLDVYPGIDLVFDVRPTGFEQYFVIHDSGALATLGFTMRLDYAVANGSLVQTGDTLEVHDSEGAAIAAIPPAIGWDASQDPFTPTPVLATWAVEGDNPASVVSDKVARTVPLQWVAQAMGTSTSVAITIPSEWATSDETTYPLVVDPVALTPYFGWDAHIRSDYLNNNYSTGTELFVGQDPTYGPVYYSLLNINTSGMLGKDIISANMYLWNNWSATCTQVGWEAYGTTAPYTYSTFNNLPTVTAAPVTSTHTRGHTSGSSPYCSQDWAWVDITTMARMWTTQTATNQGVLIKAVNNTATEWKRFYSADSSSANKPHISIWYNQAPNTPTGVAYAPALLGARAKLSATVTDPDGIYTSLRALFTVERRTIGSQGAWQVVLDQSEGSLVANGAQSIREVDLPAGFEYRVKAWAHDTRIKSTGASGYITFVIPSTSNFQDVPSTDDDDV